MKLKSEDRGSGIWDSSLEGKPLQKYQGLSLPLFGKAQTLNVWYSIAYLPTYTVPSKIPTCTVGEYAIH